MPAAAAARMLPWVEVLKDLGNHVSIFTSSSVSCASSIVTRSYFATPSNKASIPYRLIQEIVLGLDLGIKFWFRRKNCDLCIVTSPPFFMACICAYFAKLAKIPFVFDIRDRYPRVLSDLGYLKTSDILFKLVARIEGWIYYKAQNRTTVTEGLVKELSENFVGLEFNLVRNGFDEIVFTHESLVPKKRNNFTVVYHGRLGRFYDSKTYLKIINLVHQLDPTIRFLFIGELPRFLNFHKPDNLEILPAMELGNLSNILVSCHLGICLLRDLPAMKNAFPAKVYDYIGAGIPVLVGPKGESTELVNKLKLGITFEKVTARSVADSIIRIKKDPEKWEAMCSNVKKSRISFGRRKTTRKFFELIFS